MALQRRPLGQMRGEPGRPPGEAAGAMPMGGGMTPPPMDTASPRHLAPAMPMGMPGGGPTGVMPAPGGDAGMGMGGSDILAQLLALLGGRGR